MSPITITMQKFQVLQKALLGPFAVNPFPTLTPGKHPAFSYSGFALQGFHTGGIILYVVFCVQLLSLSILLLSFIHMVACVDNLLLQFARQCSTAWICQIWVPFISCTLELFPVCVYYEQSCYEHFSIGLREIYLPFFQVNTKKWDCQTMCKCIFNFVRNCQTVFQSGCIWFLIYKRKRRKEVGKSLLLFSKNQPQKSFKGGKATLTEQLSWSECHPNVPRLFI